MNNSLLVTLGMLALLVMAFYETAEYFKIDALLP